MNTVDKNPVVNTRPSKARGGKALGGVDEQEMKARVNEILNRRPGGGSGPQRVPRVLLRALARGHRL